MHECGENSKSKSVPAVLVAFLLKIAFLENFPRLPGHLSDDPILFNASLFADQRLRFNRGVMVLAGDVLAEGIKGKMLDIRWHESDGAVHPQPCAGMNAAADAPRLIAPE